MSASPETHFDRFELPSGIRLSILPTTKLKTVLVKVFFTADLDESVTRRALIPMVLRRGTRNFTNMMTVQRHLEGLYGASLGSGVQKVGEWQIVRFRLETVNGRFLPGTEDVFAEGLRFLRELIFDPFLDDERRFRRDEFEQEKNNLGRLIESLIDSKDQYALERLVQEMCCDEPYRIYEYGRPEDLPEIDAEGLTEAWRLCVDNCPCSLYVTGDVDVEETRELVESVFGDGRRGELRPAAVPALRGAAETRRFEEKMPVSQARLCLGYRNRTNYLEGDLSAQVFMNGVLGSFSHSKLFQNVREEASLAYDVGSFLDKTKGLLFVAAGIASENSARTVDIIAEQVQAIRDGQLDEEEIASTRESFDNQLQMLEDSVGDLVEVDFVWNLHGCSFELESYREALAAVSPDRVAEAARRLELDSIYLLRD